MAVQARFYVTELTYSAHDPEAAKLKLSAVVRGPENAAWSKATPSGNIEMYVTNAAAVQFFRDRQLGREDVSIVFDVAPETEDRVYSGGGFGG
jgi:hypothetical protein